MNKIKKFDLRQTNITKGIAVMLLLCHHLFYTTPNGYQSYVSMLTIKGTPIEAEIGAFCKVCVSIFLILSGYGFHKSFIRFSSECKNNQDDSSFKINLSFVKNRLLKLLAPFWFVYIIFVPIGLYFGRSFIEIYNSNLIYFFTDFFGLSYAFHGLQFTLNETWWYMSLIIVYCILYPCFQKLIDYSAELTLSIALFFCFLPFTAKGYFIYALPFVFGIYASKRDLFERITHLLSNDFKRIIFSIILVLAFALCRYFLIDHSTKLDFAFGFSIIIFIFYAISKIPVINDILEELGKKSGLIFMFHTFIYKYFFRGFIYSFKYPPLIFIVLLIICYTIAWLLQKLMAATRYNKLINKLTQIRKQPTN